jgi:hypothetical protein
MKSVNNLQYWSRFSLSDSLSSCMTYTWYGWSFKIFVALCTFHRIIYYVEKVFSVTFMESITKFDGYHPNYCHLTTKVDRNGFCPAHFLCHGNSSPDEILLICLTKEIWEMYP